MEWIIVYMNKMLSDGIEIFKFDEWYCYFCKFGNLGGSSPICKIKIHCSRQIVTTTV